jgi:hypothetical protein
MNARWPWLGVSTGDWFINSDTRHQLFCEPATQPGHLRHIGKQTGTGVSHHPAAVSRDRDLRTNSGSLHLAGAFRDG